MTAVRDNGLGGGCDASAARYFPADPAVRRNFFWAALNGALFEFGASFAEVGTIVPAFLGRLGFGALTVGAAATIARFGWLLPQLFAANYAQGLRYRKPIYLVGGGGRAASLGLLATVLLAWPAGHEVGATLPLLVAFFALWTAYSFIAGLAGVPYNDVIARTIPSDWRSRLLAVRLFAGGALAVGSGLLIRGILREAPGPSLQPYALIFAAGAVILALSTACFARIQEPPAPAIAGRPAFSAFLRDGLDVLRADRRFRLFLCAQLLGGVTRMSAPFYLLQAHRVSRVPELEVGTFLAAQMIGSVVLNPLWGWWGDRRGKLSLLRVLTGISVVSPLLAIVLPLTAVPESMALVGYALVFFFLGTATTGDIVGELGYLMEISPDDQRPEYSGYMNALVAPSRLLPFVGGVIVALWSFQLLFVLAAVAVLARLVVLARLEPATTVDARPVGRRAIP
jgi:hypothetical protein